MNTGLPSVGRVVTFLAMCAAGATLATLWSGSPDATAVRPARPAPMLATSTSPPGASVPAGMTPLPAPVPASQHFHDHQHPPTKPAIAAPPPEPSPTRDAKQDPAMPQALLFSLKGALARGNKDAAATFTERLRALGEAALPAVRKEHDETQDAEWRAALDMILAGK